MEGLSLLITSVGSAVAQAILDVLDYPSCSRRALIRLVGTNSVVDAPTNFRCNTCYLVPETLAADYPARICEILRAEKPDLILCGRDADTFALAELKESDPTLPGALPIGSARAALIGNDKWQTFLFARRHKLPFADSFAPGESGGGAALAEFCRRVGYPLVAKPRSGFASRGVYFVRNAEDAETMARPDYVLQEYLGDSRELEQYFASLVGPVPLFTQAPNPAHHSGWTMITPDGALAPIMVTGQTMLNGAASATSLVDSPDLQSILTAYARALFAEGGTGPLNVGFRRDRDGAWSVLEINLRNTGSTLSRFILGLDELYHIVQAFAPGFDFPEMRPLSDETPKLIRRLYFSHPLHEEAMSTLKKTGVWLAAAATERPPTQ